ncbi:MAG: MASE1 domain-containing protein [Acidimicrobiales bacterium]
MKLAPAVGRSRRHVAVDIAALAAVYYLAARLGLSVPFLPGNVTAVWPPTGIALAALMLWGNRLWPGAFIGALLVNGTRDVPLLTEFFDPALEAQRIRRFTARQ